MIPARPRPFIPRTPWLLCYDYAVTPLSDEGALGGRPVIPARDVWPGHFTWCIIIALCAIWHPGDLRRTVMRYDVLCGGMHCFVCGTAVLSTCRHGCMACMHDGKSMIGAGDVMAHACKATIQLRLVPTP